MAVCTCVTYVCLDGGDGSAERRVNRRKTDLMPTILSPRDLTPCSRPGSASSSRRSPGRACSMTRLDGAANAFGGGASRLSSARSMSHLAVGGGGGGGRSVLGVAKTTDRSKHHHRSMVALNNPVPPPRLTRAERLRKRAREFANGGGAGTCVCLVVRASSSDALVRAAATAFDNKQTDMTSVRPLSLRSTDKKPRPFFYLFSCDDFHQISAHVYRVKQRDKSPRFRSFFSARVTSYPLLY